MQSTPRWFPPLFATLSLLIATLGSAPARAATFTGSNAPGAGTLLDLTVSPGATTLSVRLTNSAATYSHLYLKAGPSASTNDFDFVARPPSGNAMLNLELPELVPGTQYSLWVQTPTNSKAHAFTVVTEENRAGLRQAALPVAKPLALDVTGVLNPGETNFFQVDLATRLPGWRLVLSGTGSADPDLVLWRITASGPQALRSSTGRILDTVFLADPDCTNGTYLVGVSVPKPDSGNATYRLRAETHPLVTLDWDRGLTAEAPSGYTNLSTLGGDYFFKVVTTNTSFGLWRTRLTVPSGDADLYLRINNLPTESQKDHASTRAGSDGIALVQPGQFSSGQTWYIMVLAQPGAEWSLATGAAWIPALPPPAADGSGGIQGVIAPEGINFYRTTIPGPTLAWRLGLGGLTNLVLVQRDRAAHPSSNPKPDWSLPGRLLVVPPYLKSSTEYYVSVLGTPGEPFALDSRSQPVEDLPLEGSTRVASTEAGHVTYRVVLPAEQVGWQVDLEPEEGLPQLAVRDAFVGSEFVNTAVAERTNSGPLTLTLVPPTLRDGAFYITVHGTPPFAGTLSTRRPAVRYVPYRFEVTNTTPTAPGWRYYGVTNIEDQAASLGWELLLAHQLPGTELALRRNRAPGSWNYRSNFVQGSTQPLLSRSDHDALSTSGFLQRPQHPADIWYIGVRHPAQPSGPFVLTGRDIPVTPLDLAGAFQLTALRAIPPGYVRYFRLSVPPEAVAFEARLDAVTSGVPRIAVARDLLPVSPKSLLANGSAWNSPNSATNWPSGAQIYHAADWTGFNTSAEGTNQVGHFFLAGQGNPLSVPGTYHLGIFTDTGPGATNPIHADLRVRGLLRGSSIADLAFLGGRAEAAGLAAHDSSWFRVDVPPDQSSWKFRLQMATNHEGLLVLRPGGVANYGAGQNSPATVPGARLRKAGDEHYVLLPTPPATTLPPGPYHLGIVSEGEGASSARAGSNVCSFSLTSEGPLPLLHLEDLDPFGQNSLSLPVTQAGGEVRGYRFTVREGTPALEITLKEVVGTPRMVLRADTLLPALPDAYGASGGAPATWSDNDFIRIPSPVPGDYTLLVQAAGQSGRYPDASYTLQIEAQGARPVEFDSGVVAVTNQPAAGWEYFRITVPQGILGWDLRLTNVTRGEPRLVVCRERIPATLSSRTATGASWSPFTSTNWPSGFQLAPDRDWTGYPLAANGTNQTGQVLVAPMGNPLEPGVYIVGVTGAGTPNPTNTLAYSLVSRGIGEGQSIPVQPLDFAGGTAPVDLLPVREAAYFRVTVPSNAPSWKLDLATADRDSLLVLRRGGLPNFGATVANMVTNLAGTLLQRTNDEHFVLLPFPPATQIPAGDYYAAVVSEGYLPSGTRIGSHTASSRLTSSSPLVPIDLGRLDTAVRDEIRVTQSLDGGELAAYQFEVAPGTVAVVVRIDGREGNPVMTLRSGDALPRSAETYGRQGGWNEDWEDPAYIRIPGSLGGRYRLVIQAGAVSGKIVPAAYTLRIYSLVTGTIPLKFDGGAHQILGHTSKEWLFFSVDVPPGALGWDLRLTDVSGSDPAMVLCRDDYPRGLSSTFSWSSATNWPVGGQALPGLDWTAHRVSPDETKPDNKIFAAGMGAPLTPGRYVIGVTSSDPKAEAPMRYVIRSRGIGPGYRIPVQPILAGTNSLPIPALPPREAAYFRIDVPEETPAWKLQLATLRGDGLLAVRRDALPNIGASIQSAATAAGGGHKIQKPGADHLLLAEWPGTRDVAPGRYYVAVVSEGEGPDPAKSVSGTNTSDLEITSRLPSPPIELGQIIPGGEDKLHTHRLAGGETATYVFTLPPGSLGLEASLEGISGAPLLRLRNDGHLPADMNAYGQDGGYRGQWEGTGRVALVSPTNGVYHLTVQAGITNSAYPPLDYTLRVHAESPVSVLSFDGSRIGITNHAAGLWKTFLVQVPPQALGWEIRLTEVRSGEPRLVVSRDTVPTDLRSRDDLFTMTNWPSGWQIAPESDWTGRDEADGTPATGRVFQVGMGNPLMPGLYYVAITNLGSRAATYSLTSRGIGPGFSTPVRDLPFEAGTDEVSLDPRETAWYRVNVPTNAPAWKVRMTALAGEALLLAQRGTLPSIGAQPTNSIARPLGGRLLRKLGSEQLLSLPRGGTNLTLPGGVYYLGVVAEGWVSPNNLVRLGTNQSRVSLRSEGGAPPFPLGTVGPADLVDPALLAGGESDTWQFNVREGTRAVEAWLPRTEGAPRLTLTRGPAAPGVTNTYGVDGGAPIYWESGSVVTLPNPEPGTYSLTAQAGPDATTFADARFEVRVRDLPIHDLSFDPVLDGQGRTSVGSGTIEDEHRTYYRVEIPATLRDEPVIGWRLSLSSTHGTPWIRVRRDALPDDDPEGGTSPYALRQAVFVPEYLTPGTWYVEVTAGGLTTYVLTSQALRLDRPPWTMPAPGDPVSTPGLPASGPVFGDSGVGPDGVALPGLYLDLEQDSFHYYAIRVPERNEGLLRTELIAYNGNPNLYLRRGAPPSITGKPVYDRALTKAVGTEYGLWVPLDGRAETRLAPGLWYLAVHASGGANVRYRLKASVAEIVDLPFNHPGPATQQVLAAGDWKFYRVLLPLDLTECWDVSLLQIAGEVALHLRDSLPPGMGTNGLHHITWAQDERNHGPYPDALKPGTHRLTQPPLRPGTPYYLGVRALTDARFSVASAPAGPVYPLTGVLAFADGRIEETIGPGEIRRYRIDTPPDARWFRLAAVNPSAIRFHLDQGSPVTGTSFDHWVSSGVNAVLDRALYQGEWPWYPGFRYYLSVTNASREPQAYSLRLDGRDCSNDDFDQDQVPDCWETQWFGSIYTYGADSDPDHDGIGNLDEYRTGSDPKSTATTSLRVSGLAIDAQGRLVLETTGTVGQSCRIQASASLREGSWSEVLTFVQTEPVQQVTLPPLETAEPLRFFRLVSP